MKCKILAMCLVLSMMAAISACETNVEDSDVEGEYAFTLIEFGGSTVAMSMQSDRTNRDIVYFDSRDFANKQGVGKSYFMKLDSSDGTLTKLTVDHLFDDDCTMFSIFPIIDGGCFIYALNPTVDKQILKRFTAEFEPLYEINILEYVELSFHEILRIETYDYNMCGVTDDGDPIICTPDEVFTIAPNGERKDTWEYINETGHNTYIEALVSEGDILRCVYDETLQIIYLSWLHPDGTIEPCAEIDDLYSNVMLDNGVIYVAKDHEQTLYKLNDQGEMEFLLDYSDGRSHRNFHEIIALPDGRFVGKISLGDYIISKRSADEDFSNIDEREVITIATYHGSGFVLPEQVSIFNQINKDFKIEIIDYSIFDDGIMRLNVEIIAGTAPDMIYWGNGREGIIGNFNPEIYSRAGVLVDLYEYIDSDNDIDRSSLLPNLLGALESAGGELFEMPISFYLQLYAGSADVLGTKPGWTFEEYFALLEKYPEATHPFGFGTWELFLWDAISNNYEAFIDWEKGEAYFDTSEFAGLLQMAKAYWDTGPSRLEIKYIQEGKQLLSRGVIFDVSSIQRFEALFGSGVNVIGFPTAKGIGNSFILNGSISINAASDHIDECWEFIKDLLSYDVQLNLLNGFPMNCDALAERLDNAPQYEEAGSGTGTMDSEGDRWMVIYTDATKEEIALVRGLIESTDRVYRGNNDTMEIIEEVASLYLSGDRTLEDAVRIIQSRIQTYVSEKSW